MPRPQLVLQRSPKKLNYTLVNRNADQEGWAGPSSRCELIGNGPAEFKEPQRNTIGSLSAAPAVLPRNHVTKCRNCGGRRATLGDNSSSQPCDTNGAP